MENNYDDGVNKYDGYESGPPDAQGAEREVPHEQEKWGRSAPWETQGGPPFAEPIEAPGEAPVVSQTNASINAPGGAPIDSTVSASANLPGGAPVESSFSAPTSVQGGAPVAAPTFPHANVPTGIPVEPAASPQAGAPSDRTYAPVSGGVPQQQRMPAFRNYEQPGERPFIQREEGWREPSYNQAHETVSNMYTPGIYVDQQYSRKRAAESQTEPKAKKRSGSFGRFLRAACLVILCAALSGVSTYMVMDYRISRGDFATEPVKQVVIGGSNTNSPRSDGLANSVVATGNGMPAEDIYDMACKQVVGIRTEVPFTGGYLVPEGSNIVSGSGFIISSDGYILTNYHVIETSYRSDIPLLVTLGDGMEFEAKVIGYEESNDIALIKIEASDLNAVIIANSDDIRVGQPVYAVGNPFGDLVYTMTEGIVSALDRVVTVDRKSIETFQLSAAVNEGNSGGPVYDANGEVIGIVSAKIMGSYVEGIGFAIPINDAIEIASKLIEHGYISGRPLIGVNVNTVTSAHADYYGWVVGAYVRSISPDSAAERAGLVVGDIIISLGDSSVDSMETLLFTMRRYKAGDTVDITVWRSGREVELTITFDENLTAGQPQRMQTDQLDPQEQPNQKPPVVKIP